MEKEDLEIDLSDIVVHKVVKGETQSLEFCLLKSLGVRPIALEARIEDQPHIPNPRHVALSPEAVARRRAQIAQTAVTFPKLMAIDAVNTSRDLPVYQPVASSSKLTLPFLLVTERPRPNKPSRFSRATPSPPPERGLGGKMCCPTIIMSAPPNKATAASKSQVRRRRAKGAADKSRVRPVASFWAPPEGLGGKSEGYGFGYVGSEAGERERRAYWGSGHQRDRMKSGVVRMRW